MQNTYAYVYISRIIVEYGIEAQNTSNLLEPDVISFINYHFENNLQRVKMCLSFALNSLI